MVVEDHFFHPRHALETVPRCSRQDIPRVDDTPCTLTMAVTRSLSSVTWTPAVADGRYVRTQLCNLLLEVFVNQLL